MPKQPPYYTLAALTVVLAIPLTASAHVIVTPSQVGVASSQVFSISIPSEKDEPVKTTALRLVLPSGLQDVMPTVEPGWTITTKKDGDTVTEIDWTEGSIPSGQRADFTFSAQVPATTGDLAWKAYQVFSDGSTTAWDQAPIVGREEDDSLTPYSHTQVVNDLTAPAPTKQTPLWLGITALFIAILGIGYGIIKKK